MQPSIATQRTNGGCVKGLSGKTKPSPHMADHHGPWGGDSPIKQSAAGIDEISTAVRRWCGGALAAGSSEWTVGGIRGRHRGP